MKLSVIIPTLNEASYLGPTLDRAAAADPVPERIVVDAGSDDATVEVARAHEARVIEAAEGRGTQQREGARAASGDVLLFLHADTLLPERYRRHVGETLERSPVSAGAFQLRINRPDVRFRWIERMVLLRSRVAELPYGDQALFMRRATYEQAGGMPPVPLMEDVMMVRRLRRLGRVQIVPAKVETSGRRWERHGILRNTFINQLLFMGFHLGLSPETLRGYYD